MRKVFIVIFTVCLMIGLLEVLALDDRQRQLEDKIVNQQSTKSIIEEPQRMDGKWQIILYESGIFPPRIIKTNCYFIRDKVIWYIDAETGDELPLPDGALLLPDDGRDMEQYGVYDLTGLDIGDLTNGG